MGGGKTHVRRGYDSAAVQKQSSTVTEANSKVRGLHVFTESGYLMLVKSMTDDTAWAVQRELVNHYFRVHGTVPVLDSPRETQPGRASTGASRPLPEVLKLVVKFLPQEYRQALYYRGHKGLTQAETGAIIGIGYSVVGRIERELKEIGFDVGGYPEDMTLRRRFLGPRAWDEPQLTIPGVPVDGAHLGGTK